MPSFALTRRGVLHWFVISAMQSIRCPLSLVGSLSVLHLVIFSTSLPQLIGAEVAQSHVPMH